MDIGLRRAQEKYFEQNKKEILEGKSKRFAMVHTNQVEYFKDRESLYKAYPHLAPGAPSTLGNSPMFIDIGKETNSIEYRKEEFKKRENKFHKDLEKLAKESELIRMGRIELYN